MFDPIELGREFFERLRAIDEATVAKVAAQACRFCRGPLHRGDYPRKPRGGLLGAAVEAHDRRLSLCCGRERCRRRETPPSVRFLGRRVYAGVVVVVASVVALPTAKNGTYPHVWRMGGRWPDAAWITFDDHDTNLYWTGTRQYQWRSDRWVIVSRVTSPPAPREILVDQQVLTRGGVRVALGMNVASEELRV